MPNNDDHTQTKPFSSTTNSPDRSFRFSTELYGANSNGTKLLKSQLVAANKARKLSHPDRISQQQRICYKRFQQTQSKESFRGCLRSIFGDMLTPMLNYLEQDGLVLFRDFLSITAFEKLVSQYEVIMADSASHSTIHAYRNLKYESQFLTNLEFKDSFFHPLLIVLMAYRMGGPVRLVDARSKDTWPMNTIDQDNQPHLDNSPFSDEYKVLLMWEKGSTNGPIGQNFVAIPGTHLLVRNQMTEDASVFVTEDDIDQEILDNPDVKGKLAVIEAEDSRPLTALFSASSLVHHRYRTLAKRASRSCIILAFHRREDDPGEFLFNIPEGCSALEEYLLTNSPDNFLDLISQSREKIQFKINSLLDEARLIPARTKALNNIGIQEWRKVILSAKRVEDRKPRFPCDTPLNDQEVFERLLEIIMHDKQGNLDLILYPDGHEESRKYARNRIREMDETTIRVRVEPRFYILTTPKSSNLIACKDLLSLSKKISDIFRELGYENMSRETLEEWRSLCQLATDLGESISRCKTLQSFRTTSLFLYWVFDDAYRLSLSLGHLGSAGVSKILDADAQNLFQHYFSSCVFDDISYIAD